jgi:hypothetical protein
MSTEVEMLEFIDEWISYFLGYLDALINSGVHLIYYGAVAMHGFFASHYNPVSTAQDIPSLASDDHLRLCERTDKATLIHMYTNPYKFNWAIHALTRFNYSIWVSQKKNYSIWLIIG